MKNLIFLLTIFSFSLNSQIFAHRWEMGLKVLHTNGSPIIKTIYIFRVETTIKGNIKLVEFDHGDSRDDLTFFGDSVNAACDVYDDAN